MQGRFRDGFAIVVAAWSLVSCSDASRAAGEPLPEAEQVISEGLKGLYMAASTAAPRSAEQHKILLRMAQKASNGKELLLAMRAAVGVFPATDQLGGSVERQIQTLVTTKMMRVATLGQLIEYASQYSVGAESARPFVQRMLQLGEKSPDARTWYRIKAAAFHLRVADLERQAQARAEQLADR